MIRKEELLTTLDEVWIRKWESLDTIVDGITEEQALYQHPSYSMEPEEENHPPVGSILYLLVHLYDVYRYYKVVINERPNDVVCPPPPASHSIAEALAYIKHFRAELRDTIASLSEAQLDEHVSPGDRTVAQLVRMLARHDAWHTGQIAMKKRMGAGGV